MNEKEFKTYLLLYAANADFKIQEEEKSIILAAADATQMHHIYKKFEADNDYKRIETILSNRDKFYRTSEDVEKLLAEISSLLFSDEKFNINERNFFQLLKKLLINK